MQKTASPLMGAAFRKPTGATDTTPRRRVPQELARLLRVPDLKEYRGSSPGWTARGFEISDYDLENITEGKPVHCRIAVPLDAFRLIAPIIAACYPTDSPAR